MSGSLRIKGFTLVEIAVVMVIIGLSLGTVMISMKSFRSTQNRKDTVTRIATVDVAMANFVLQSKRLPCPADGAIGTGLANAGVEQRNGAGDCTTQNRGIVPWVTLGLTESAGTDAWGNRLTYRVPTGATGYTRNSSFDMSSCDPAGTGPVINSGTILFCQVRPPCAASAAASCTTPANYMTGAGRGLQVQSVGGAVVMNPLAGTGAAYIVISAGDNFGGAYSPGGTILGVTSPPMGNGENINANNQALQAAYIDDNLIDAATALHFDDIVSRPSILTVLTKAQLGPRGF
jgi:prepilin-type N-terminal cleavage/methylation domain-containing protein